MRIYKLIFFTLLVGLIIYLICTTKDIKLLVLSSIVGWVLTWSSYCGIVYKEESENNNVRKNGRVHQGSKEFISPNHNSNLGEP